MTHRIQPDMPEQEVVLDWSARKQKVRQEENVKSGCSLKLSKDETPCNAIHCHVSLLVIVPLVESHSEAEQDTALPRVRSRPTRQGPQGHRSRTHD